MLCALQASTPLLAVLVHAPHLVVLAQMRMIAGAPHLVVLAFICVTAGAGAAHLAVLVSANFHMDINTPHLVLWSLTLDARAGLGRRSYHFGLIVLALSSGPYRLRLIVSASAGT